LSKIQKSEKEKGDTESGFRCRRNEGVWINIRRNNLFKKLRKDYYTLPSSKI